MINHFSDFYGDYVDHWMNPLTETDTRASWQERKSFSGAYVIRYLGIPKTHPNPIQPWNLIETDEMTNLVRGCFGMNAIRLGISPKQLRIDLPGLRVFNDIEAAYRAQFDHATIGKVSIIFAAQSIRPLSAFNKDILSRSVYGNPAWIEYSPRTIDTTNLLQVDFSTGIQDRLGNVVIWEGMVSGISRNSNLTVLHRPSISNPNYKTTFYCVVEVAQHKFQPPVLPLSGIDMSLPTSEWPVGP